MPTPSVAFCTDWVNAVTFASSPLAIARPAGSSAPELMRWPVESCCRVLLRDICVEFNEFSACSEEMLFRMLNMVNLLRSNSTCAEGRGPFLTSRRSRTAHSSRRFVFDRLSIGTLLVYLNQQCHAGNLLRVTLKTAIRTIGPNCLMVV